MADKHNNHVKQHNIAVILLVLVGFIMFLPQLPSFSDGVTTLRNADFAYLLLGFVTWLSTFFSAALVYVFLSKKPLSLSKTLLIQFASGFTNRLAPSGTGAIATSTRYLIKNGYKTTQAGTIVGINNLLGFIGTFILLVGLIIGSGEPLGNYFRQNLYVSGGWVITAFLVVAAGLGLIVFARKKVIKVSRTIWSTALDIARNPLYLAAALLASIGITVGYALTLYAIGLAFNVHLHAVQILLVITLGVAAASVTPTPGGIGGAEVGLAAALVAVGVTSHQALTVALIYRLVTYWLAILPGFICFERALRRRYI